MPGRFAETVGLDDSFEQKNSWAQEASMPGRRGRAAGASQPFAKRKRAAVLPREDWNFCDIGATNVKETRLGEPVLGEPSNEVGASHQTRLGRAIKRGWGEPSNEVGASQC